MTRGNRHPPEVELATRSSTQRTEDLRLCGRTCQGRLYVPTFSACKAVVSGPGGVPSERLRQGIDDVRGDQPHLAHPLCAEVASEAVEVGSQDRGIEVT